MFFFCFKAARKAILNTNDEGTFFDEALLRYILQRKNAEVLSILQDVDPSLLTDSSGTTLLHYAARYGNKEFAQHLIDSGTTIDARNQSAETPLMSAVDCNQEDTVKLLLEANADPLVPDVSGRCALGKALGNKQNVNEKIATAILNEVTVDSLNRSEHANSQKFHSDCPLYHFISLKNAEITRILLEKGSTVDARNPKTQDTALHEAVKRLDLENVKVLLEFNADVNAQRCNGLTPLANIPIEPHEDQSKALIILKVLIAAGASLIDSASRKIMARSLLLRGNREIVRTVLQCPIDLQFRNERGETALHILVSNKHADVLEEVQDLKSAAQIRTEAGFTMLHIAAAEANLNAIKQLLDNGVDVDIIDERGITPLFYAVCSFAPFGKDDNLVYDYLHSIEILLEHGARPVLRPSIYEVHDFESVKDKYMLLVTPLLAKLALMEESGLRIREERQIESSEPLKIIYDSKKRELYELKRTQIDESTSLFDILLATDEMISQYARNPGLFSNLTEAMKECSSDSYYHRRLQKRFSKLTRLVETRKKVVTAIIESFNKLYNVSVDMIAEKIVNYLEDKDLCQS